jgi:predicted RND superfamily exporter protein
LIGFAAVIILLFYFLGFRSIRAVVLPFLVVLMGTIWCLGFMAIFGLSLSIINIVIPPLVLTLGSSYSIHILNQYYREAGKNHPNGLWIAGAVTHVNRTIIMAAVTTIAGFLSLLAATMEQTRVFAVTTSFGILSCALLSLFFFPAVLSRLSHPSSNQSRQVVQGLLTRLIKKLGDFVVRRRIPVLLVWAVIIIFFGLSAKRLEYSTDAVSYFPQRDKVMKDMYFLTEKIGGFDEISVTIVAPQNEKNYFLQQPVLEKLSLLEEDLLSNPDISYVSSFIGYLKYINETVTGVSEIPQSKGLILLFSRFLKTFSSRENISRYLALLANEEFSRITLSLRVFNSETGKYIDEARFRAILERLEVSIPSILPPEIEWTIWGNGLRYVYLSDMIKKDHLLFMIISLSAILLITTIAFRSFRFGLYTLIPLVTGIIFNFIAMIILAVPLDMITVMVSSVAIGVGADDSIHFLLQFRRQLKKYPDNIAGAVSESLGITGRPILLTTVSIVGGLAVFAFASFKPIMYFGMLVIVALAAACAGTLCILPAVLTLTWKTRGKK